MNKVKVETKKVLDKNQKYVDDINTDLRSLEGSLNKWNKLKSFIDADKAAFDEI